MRQTAYVVGVDLGGTQIRAGLVTTDGRLVRRTATLTRPQEGVEAVIHRIESQIRSVMEGQESQVVAIGVASPGAIDVTEEIVRFSPNLAHWRDVPLAQRLRDALDKPVYVGNDANLAALGEHLFGAGRGVDHMVYITVSTGIGGGIIIGGHLLVGAHGYAAEIGHHTVAENGPVCKCGNVGCLEAVASGTAIAREARKAVAEERSTRLREMCAGDIWRIDARMVADAAREGDAVAREIFYSAGHYLGVGILNLLHIFNPRRIILGGSVMKAGPLITEPMWAVLKERAGEMYLEDFDIVDAALGDDVGILGAAAYALTRQESAWKSAL